MIRVAYLIRALETGGAERQLVALAKALDPREFEVSVLTFYDRGPLGAELADSGVPVISLDKGGRWDFVAFLRRLREALRRRQPDILHSYLTMANLFGLVAGRAQPETKLVWGRRASAMDMAHYDFWTGATEWLERRCAGRPDMIVFNAEAGRRDYLAKSARPLRAEVAPNGTDCARFTPRPEVRAGLRAAWGIDAGAPLIGIVARLDPMKGHGVFLEAAALALKQRPELRFVCMGDGPLAESLQERCASLDLNDAVVWAGARRDVPEALSALDLHTSASIFGEGFSNAIAESMAAGLPNVVTDVGDSARIVGETGLSVPPGQPAALARAWLEILGRERRAQEALGQSARQRILDNFSLDSMVQRTAALYRSLQASRAAKGA